MWQLIESADENENARLDAKRALKYIIDLYFIQKSESGYCLVENKTHLGINSFLLLAILSLNDKKFLMKERQLLIMWIESQLSHDKTHFIVTDDEELLYPAQALLALIALFEQTNNDSYLSIVKMVFSYYRKIFQDTDKKTVMCNWFSKVCKKKCSC